MGPSFMVESMNNSFSQPASDLDQRCASVPFARRRFLTGAGAVAAGSCLGGLTRCAVAAEPSVARNRIGISTYSFWQFNRRENRDIEKCIDLAAEMGFDGVELLH